MVLKSLVAIALVAAVSTGSARADTIKFCFTGPMVYVDNGWPLPDEITTEDFWAGDGTARFLRGAKMVVKIGSTTYFDDVLGDGQGTGDPGNGCTSTLTVPNANSTYNFYHYSEGTKIDNDLGGQHTVNVKRIVDVFTTSSLTQIIPYVHASGSGTFSIELWGSSNFENMLRLQTTSAFVLWRTGRVADANTFAVYLDERTNAGNKHTDNGVYITANGSSRKFIVGHEMGHAVGDCYAAAAFGADYGYNDPNADCSSTGGGHNLGSKEYQPAAFQEGIADAFSVFTWNLTTETDCVYYTNSSTTHARDCEGSQSFENRWMEMRCSTPFSGYGVQIDWLKAFWDVHTNGGVDLGDFVDWLWDASWFWGWSQSWSDPYIQLDDAADDCGSACDDLDANWDVAKTSNGIDW